MACPVPRINELGEPSASRWEILPQVSHRQVDGADRTPHAYIASAAVLGLAEHKAGVVVVMEGAERLMVLHLHPHLFRNLLYRKFAQYVFESLRNSASDAALAGSTASKSIPMIPM